MKQAEEHAQGVGETDIVTWKTILGACRTQRAAARALALAPQDAATHILLANIYARGKMWEKNKALRAQMALNGVRKTAGKSWIEVNGNVSYFQANDKTHPLTSQIYAQIEKLKQRLKKQGYEPETCFVSRDVEENQKEHLLWYHSEKLALAYGLISLPSTQPITIINNLRVCGDCHKAITSPNCTNEIFV